MILGCWLKGTVKSILVPKPKVMLNRRKFIQNITKNIKRKPYNKRQQLTVSYFNMYLSIKKIKIYLIELTS